MKRNMQIIVCQRGARHRYAIARMLNQAGMLRALYTDSNRYSMLGKMAEIVSKFHSSSSMKHLLARTPAGIPRELIFSTDRLWVQQIFHRPLQLGNCYKRWGVENCDAIYSFYGEELDFLEYAKSRGKKIIVDVIIHPFYQKHIADEAIKYPFYDIDPNELYLAHEKHLEKTRKIFSLADQILAPSEWVKEGILAVSQNLSAKVSIVPYGNSIDYCEKKNEPVQGRILFVGHDPLRKGIHQLAAVMPALKQQFPDVSCRLVGISADECSRIPHANLLNCIGNLPMWQVKEEYLKADVLVMPSVSEGQTSVVLEALSAGVPVVITRQSGIDIVSGREGFCYEAGDLNALREGLTTIIENRNLRGRMSSAATKFAQKFTYAFWQKNLTDRLKDLQ